jgi:hypothetical protein
VELDVSGSDRSWPRRRRHFPAQRGDATFGLTAFAALGAFAAFGAGALALAALESQQHVSPQQAGPQQQATRQAGPQQQVSPQQHAWAALTAFDFSAATAPTLNTEARAIAPTTLSIRRRSMIRLLFF